MNRNIAVVGCGLWGKNLVRNFADLEALRVVCDVAPLKLQSLVEQYPQVQCRTDLYSVLSDEGVKGVVVATPAATHYAVAKAALEAGKDVLVEKPLALRVNEGAKLVRIAEEKGLVLMVGHLLSYHPAVMKLKQLIVEGALGDIYTMHSSRLNLGRIRQEENVLWDFAPHDISIFTLLTGEMPKSVSAWGSSYLQQGIHDVATVLLEFPGGVQGHIFVSWLYPQKEQRLAVIGEGRMAVFDDLRAEGQLTLYDYAIQWEGHIPSAVRGEQQIVEVGSEEPLRSECQHFLDCIAYRHIPRTDGRNGLDVLHILEACQTSLEQRGAGVALQKRESVFIDIA